MWKLRLRYDALVLVLRLELGSMQKNQAYVVLVPPPASPPRPRPCPQLPSQHYNNHPWEQHLENKKTKIISDVPSVEWTERCRGGGGGGVVRLNLDRVSKAEGSSEATKALFSSWRVKTEKKLGAHIFTHRTPTSEFYLKIDLERTLLRH